VPRVEAYDDGPAVRLLLPVFRGSEALPEQVEERRLAGAPRSVECDDHGLGCISGEDVACDDIDQPTAGETVIIRRANWFVSA
jgi:hypothetical protein